MASSFQIRIAVMNNLLHEGCFQELKVQKMIHFLIHQMRLDNVFKVLNKFINVVVRTMD